MKNRYAQILIAAALMIFAVILVLSVLVNNSVTML